MRADDLHQGRTRTRATAVIAAVVLFHMLLVILMGLLIAGLVASVYLIVQEGRVDKARHLPKFAIALWVTWQAFSVRIPLTAQSDLADLTDYPGLAEALDDAALRVNAEVPRAVVLTVGPAIAAKEEGGWLAGLLGARRLLIVGAAAMPYLTDTELRCLLARALARWSRKETWYGIQARRVDAASSIMVEYWGSATLKWINPFYWLFVGFRAGFGRILAAYLRERDLWADQMAVQAYTAADAESAVKKQCLYEAFWKERLSEKVKAARSLQECWQMVMAAAAHYGGWHDLWAGRLAARPDPRDPRPGLAERLDALAASREMPAPAREPLSPATGTLLR